MTGAVLIDKPEGFTSFDVIAVMRRVLGTRKLGHTGTLDPMATGVLPILAGRATRLTQLLPESDKAYRATMRLGLTTDTLDITGKLLTESKSLATAAELEGCLGQFRGDILQVPPMYSAKKVDGKRLYDLAREGKEIERAAVPVTVKKLELSVIDEASGEYSLEVLCSKGTYIRSIIDDLGRAVGCGAVMTGLRRTLANGISAESCIPLDKAREMSPEELITPLDGLLAPYGEVRVTAPQANRFLHGGELEIRRLPSALPDSRFVRVLSPDGELLGLSETRDGSLWIKCLLTENTDAG